MYKDVIWKGNVTVTSHSVIPGQNLPNTNMYESYKPVSILAPVTINKGFFSYKPTILSTRIISCIHIYLIAVLKTAISIKPIFYQYIFKSLDSVVHTISCLESFQ